MKRILTLLFPLMASLQSYTQQSYSLNDVLQLCTQNYPLVKQQDMLHSIQTLQENNADKMWLPSVTLNGQATYQSAVTELPISLPGVSVPALPKDQYRLFVDANQVLYDGGAAKARKINTQNTTALNLQKNTVDIYAAKQMVIQYFANIILLQKTIDIYELSKASLEELKTKTQKLQAQEMVLATSVSEINSQLIQVQQQIVEATYKKESLIKGLGILCNTNFTEDDDFSTTIYNKENSSQNRPEFALMELQKKQLASQLLLTKANNRPKVSAFIQGGLGRPALNMLSPDFEPYYMGGLRFSYPLSNLYTFKNDQKTMLLQQSIINNQKEVLEQKIAIQDEQYKADIDKYEQLILLDNQNINELEEILKVYQAKYNYQAVTVDELTKNMNRLEQAKINKTIHEINQQFTKINQLYNQGKL